MRKIKGFAVSSFCVLILMSLILIGVTSASYRPEILGGKVFDQYWNGAEEKNDSVLAQAGDIKITTSKVKYLKELNSAFGVEKSEMEIISQLILEELLLKEAEKVGVVISDEEVRQYMDEVRVNMPNDKVGYDTFMLFIRNSGWTEDEYWIKSFPVYKKAYTIGKFRNFYLKEQFESLNPMLKTSEINVAFDIFYEEYTDNLLNKVEIQYAE